ncbi:hypothetical protein ACFS2B_12705 [Ignatzschineria indica]|uniref:hypothetical protein n=1 Tax=Ignatzschineria indica TaxID=472583 RepID=UPI003626FE5A
MKSKAFKKVVLVSALALVLAACGEEKAATPTKTAESPAKEQSSSAVAETKRITVKHDSGETVVPFAPEKVVAFDFGALDTLESLDIDIIGLPKANLPAYLNDYSADKYQNFGTLKEPILKRFMQQSLILLLLRYDKHLYMSNSLKLHRQSIFL